MKPIVSIIWFGRFWKLFATLLRDKCDVVVTSYRDQSAEARELWFIFLPIHEALKRPVLIYAVPIGKFEETIQAHVPFFWEEVKTIIDVLSVKSYARDILTKYISSSYQILLTHPMFGPDSIQVHGVSGLPIVLDGSLCNAYTLQTWQQIFGDIGLEIHLMTADEHDGYAAMSQWVAHFIGRVLENFNLVATPIDTVGAKKLQEITEQVCHDSWDLFLDLQRKNPHTKHMRKELKKSFESIYELMLPPKQSGEVMRIGIQWGQWSFNDIAVRKILKEKHISDYEVIYLYTTANVLEALKEGEIRVWQFALFNLLWGIVEETVYALAECEFKFSILEKFSHPIHYHLMIPDGQKIESITRVVAHPIAFEQCKNTLKTKFPHLTWHSGEGDFLDIARWWEEALVWKLTNTALLWPEMLMKLYNLSVLDSHLEDSPDNVTYFTWIERV